MLAYDDLGAEPLEAAELDVGPIRYAHVEPGLTIVVGERGVLREVNGAVHDRLPEQVTDVSPVIPANAGAGYHNLIGLGEAMIEPARDVEKPEGRLSFKAIEALMRPAMRSLGGGGGGSGRRRTKPKPPPLGEQPDLREPKRVIRVQVTGLTAGERAYYFNRRDEATRVLRATVGEIVVGAVENERPAIGARGAHAFSVYDLDDHEARILKVYPGSARAALVKHARDADGARVKEVDAR